MASLFIVDDDSQFRSALTRELEGRGFQVASASSVHSALAALAKRPADVVLTDLWLGGPDGLDLLKLLPSVSRRSRTIVMSAHASARDHQVATELGAVDILLKPFSSTELLRSIQKAIDCETGFQGSVHGLSLIDMAQMFHLSQRSVTIVVTHADQPSSKIHIRRGEIIDAAHGSASGCSALRAILASSSGTLHTTSLEEDVVPTIAAPFDQLLLTSLTQLDEEQHEEQRAAAGETVFEFEGVDDDEPAAPRPAAAPTRVPALDAACRRLGESVDGALVCAVVDLASGDLLGYHARRIGAVPLTEAALAAAGVALFGGRLALGRLQEVQLTAAEHYVFARRLAGRDWSLVLCTDRSISIGLGWAQLRAQIGLVESLAT
ncbi:response regulator [Nannocystis bainbridge]|uniref:Response regulator n=1 Tax=Nannocystis bainbridge TaxID=2995303 RepID=A0ABT5ECY7_9BACT|nr:response regulator [Nannocystis bainbridge]MDC0723726.1 response regulator [Nannocystis bainbridge]